MSETAIRLTNTSKMYRLYAHPVDRVLDALGVNRWLFWRQDYYRAFWALRDVDLEIPKGQRLGIIGSNGAGKSTLLKLVTGNLAPTDGTIDVNGRVQALMEIGTGFHPEFTGRQNIHASLAYQGLTRAQIAAREDDIIDFAELEDFIDQPVKTYSAGMYTRLAFSTATSIQPDILIIDEVLGAGDAYFGGKCVERMRGLTEATGATVLFVSHDLTSMQRLCTSAIWLDRGKVVMHDTPLVVVKAYEKFVRRRQEQRLRARNLKAAVGRDGRADLDQQATTLLFRFTAPPGTGEGFLLHHASLLQNDETLAELAMGDAQDCDPSHGSWAIMDKHACWGEPVQFERGRWARELVDRNGRQAQGHVGFRMWAYDPQARYCLRLQYWPPMRDGLTVEVYDGRQYVALTRLSASPTRNVQDLTVELPALALAGVDVVDEPTGEVAQGDPQVSKWPGTHDIVVQKVALLDPSGAEKSIFQVGDPLTLRIDFVGAKDGEIPVVFTAVLLTLDGVRVSCHIMEDVVLDLKAGQTRQMYLEFGPLNLGNGRYVFSIGLYRSLDQGLLTEPVIYDLADRSYEFQVVGRTPMDSAVFRHPSRWRLDEMYFDDTP